VKILVLAARFPFPTERGDKLRLYHQLRLLAKRHQIVLCALTEHTPEAQDYAVLESICEKIYLFPCSKIQIFFNLLNGFLRQKPLQVAYFNNAKTARQIADIAHIEQPDVVYCQLIRMAAYAEKLPFKKVLDYMDAFSVAAQRRAQTAAVFTRWFWLSEEKKLIQLQNACRSRFDASTVIAAQDDDFINPNKQLPRSIIVPNGVDTVYFQSFSIENKKLYDLVFIGNMGYFPNIEAAKWLVQKLLPILPPHTTLLIAGARPTAEVQALANTQNVTVTGWIPDIRSAYASAKIFVAPLFHGSGQQNKILEAMSIGIPCITTEMVNNAIGAQAEQQILVANTPEMFVRGIEKLMKNADFYQTVRQNALQFVEEKYSWETAIVPLERLLEQYYEQHQS
jgi:polysaccharide biosynthesis protein PslH